MPTRTHGKSEQPIWRVHKEMKSRCNNPNNKDYENYGGRGISYSKDWERFENFYKDMGDCPEGCELDRIDVDGNYCKENCRWAENSLSAFNKRKQRNNTSGKTGVYWQKNMQKWQALFVLKGERIHLGTFSELDEAVAARECKEIEIYGHIKE